MPSSRLAQLSSMKLSGHEDSKHASRVSGRRSEDGATSSTGCLTPFGRRAHQVVDQDEGKATQRLAQHSYCASGVDWAALPSGILTKIFDHLLQENSTWPERKVLFSASGICSNWRGLATEVFFRRQEKPATILHPCELFGTRRYRNTGVLLHALLIREKHNRGHTQYFLYLGEPEPEQREKFLLAATQMNRFGKHRFMMRLCPEYSPDDVEGDCISFLKTNVLGTGYELFLTPSGKVWKNSLSCSGVASSSKPQPRTTMGNMKYKRNFFGIRGPRRIDVKLPHLQGFQYPAKDASVDSRLADLQKMQSSMDAAHAVPVAGEHSSNESEASVTSLDAEDLMESSDWREVLDAESDPHNLTLRNVPPHWHEILQCWCLNFGGRVKEASVKNFQLMNLTEPDRVIMQFGKVSKDKFILDFDPSMIAPVQAFAVALSSFESKLPYE
uniref:Tubby like protein 3 isoform 1 n=1 Tax=Tetraselmis sp. GSL018 TaxID=582737 RepID=A0A061SFA5_9CHLO|eukprot:CAMPEP_0177591340 /NCGR_PEP_ID=MMETSP0419_2-20121207/7943_1 /TAXON_ID=582737 /ORGANISM="Tetraselmis sp., Strain GSL018" /LENGTH=442 /DNA_ID=CAMNT_0019082071 /DNA_START=377 /DNA_END=1705 /DNA_ORIENTATION=-